MRGCKLVAKTDAGVAKTDAGVAKTDAGVGIGYRVCRLAIQLRKNFYLAEFAREQKDSNSMAPG